MHSDQRKGMIEKGMTEKDQMPDKRKGDRNQVQGERWMGSRLSRVLQSA